MGISPRYTSHVVINTGSAGNRLPKNCLDGSKVVCFHCMGFGSKDFVFVDSLGSQSFFESSSLLPMVMLSDGHFNQAQKMRVTVTQSG